MKGLEEDGPTGLSSARGFPVQSGWVRYLGTQTLVGGERPPSRAAAEGGRSVRWPFMCWALYFVCSSTAAGHMNPETCADRRI